MRLYAAEQAESEFRNFLTDGYGVVDDFDGNGICVETGDGGFEVDG